METVSGATSVLVKLLHLHSQDRSGTVAPDHAAHEMP